MKPWKLQLPIASPGQPQTISSSQLQGCGGYQDPGHKYFFTESGDGALVMKVPGSPDSAGCVTTPNSKHCRTELREANPSDGSAATWSPNAAKSRLYASLSVAYADESSHGSVIGQIHIDDSISTKPVCELFYNSKGDISMGVEQTRAGNNLLFTPIGNIPVGQQFSYEIRYESNVLSVGINGGAKKVLDTYELNAPTATSRLEIITKGTIHPTCTSSLLLLPIRFVVVFISSRRHPMGYSLGICSSIL